ncbi:MAG: FAD-dependent oxidoreductase [bacterium]
MTRKKIILLALVISCLGMIYAFDLHSYFQPGFFRQFYQDAPLTSAAIFFALYVLAAAFSIPAAAVLTVIAGMTFGLLAGTALVSFASSIGATLAFLAARFLFREWVQRKLSAQLQAINRGVEREGWMYLMVLRLIPLFPFWAINLAMSVTPIKARTFYWVSQLGMLPATAVYVYAGTELGQVDSFSLDGILTPGIVFAFALLALFPFIARKAVDSLRRNRIFRRYEKPEKFDANLLVIGAGSGGLVSAYIAAAVKAKVILVEKAEMGGDCLNTGCVPSKALIRAASAMKEIRRAGELGIDVAEPSVNFPAVMARVQAVVKSIAPHDSIERYTDLGVECVTGEARVLDPWRVAVGDRVMTAKNIVVATGGKPFVPPIPGLESIDYLTSDNLWKLQSLPESLLVVGAGPIGCELAQAFQRLGSRVTLVDQLPRVLAKEDEDVSDFMAQRFGDEGMEVLLPWRVNAFEKRDGSISATLESEQGRRQVCCEQVLIAVGRKPNTRGVGLEELGVAFDGNDAIQVDEYLRTTVPNIYAVGDAISPYQFTHTASHEAWFAVVNALFGRFRKFKVDYRVVPWVTFTDPEVARVGLSETEAEERGIPVEVTRYSLDGQDRFLAENAAQGFIKVLTPPGKDKVLGAVIVGAHAGELLPQFVAAMKQGYGLNKILGTIYAYPTMGEAGKALSGQWRQNHKPEKILKWLARYHAWARRPSP